MKTFVRLVLSLVVLSAMFFVAVPRAAAEGEPPEVEEALELDPYCLNPESTVFEELAGFPLPPFYNSFFFNLYCQPAFVQVSQTGQQPARMDFFTGFVTATIYGIPGKNFKAFMAQHAPQPGVVPDGWYIYGYGVDIFYDDGNVNPSGVVCFQLPPDVLGNFELGVFSYKNGTFTRISNTGCGSFSGGGSFFLLMKTNPLDYFAPLD